MRENLDVWLAIAFAILLIVLLLTWRVESRHPEPLGLTPTLTGDVEYCLTCHADLDEISPSHPVETFGCVICHGGERLALNANLAHSSMRGGSNPSDLTIAEASCGGDDCHSGSATDQRDHIQRVTTSIQATYAGAIANIRYTFGAQADLNPNYGSQTVTDSQTQTEIESLKTFDPFEESNPSIRKFGENCLTCHIYADPLPGDAYDRFTGCAACHTTTQLSQSQDEGLSTEIEGTAGDVHILTTVMPYTNCNTCHNRGNYDLRTMEFFERTDHPLGRLYNYYQPIAQFTQCEYTLDCIDCHTRTEAMGDGDIHPNQKDIQYVQCKTCHGTLTEPPQTKELTDPDDIAFTLAFLNPAVDLELGDTILVTENGESIWNTQVFPDGRYELTGKASGQQFSFRPVMGSGCQQDPAQQESRYCHECHSVER